MYLYFLKCFILCLYNFVCIFSNFSFVYFFFSVYCIITFFCNSAFIIFNIKMFSIFPLLSIEYLFTNIDLLLNACSCMHYCILLNSCKGHIFVKDRSTDQSTPRLLELYRSTINRIRVFTIIFFFQKWRENLFNIEYATNYRMHFFFYIATTYG